MLRYQYQERTVPFFVQSDYLCRKTDPMLIATYSDFRQNLKMYLDDVFKNKTPLFVTRTKGENVVVLSQADYNSIMETFHLLSSPKNAARLQSALDEYHKGLGQEQQLIEA